MLKMLLIHTEKEKLEKEKCKQQTKTQLRV